jgi:DNA-binding response OmpR family regulator
VRAPADLPALGQLRAATPAPPRPALGDAATDLGVAEPYLLIIEDDPVTAAQVVELAHARGLKALVAADGEAGVRLATQRRPMGIVLDVRLPGIDGWTVMERLRADPSTSAVPVHFVSAAEGRSRALAMGAIGYLTKPASVGELAGRVACQVPNMSQHLSVLRSAGLVTARRDGSTVYYRLADPKVLEACQLLQSLAR